MTLCVRLEPVKESSQEPEELADAVSDTGEEAAAAQPDVKTDKEPKPPQEDSKSSLRSNRRSKSKFKPKSQSQIQKGKKEG